nr:MAG TPA: hypothetical protein [Caudoviricetes sp.]
MRVPTERLKSFLGVASTTYPNDTEAGLRWIVSQISTWGKDEIYYLGEQFGVEPYCNDKQAEDAISRGCKVMIATKKFGVVTLDKFRKDHFSVHIDKKILEKISDLGRVTDDLLSGYYFE